MYQAVHFLHAWLCTEGKPTAERELVPSASSFSVSWEVLSCSRDVTNATNVCRVLPKGKKHMLQVSFWLFYI